MPPRIHSPSQRCSLLLLALILTTAGCYAQSVAGFVHRKIQNFEQRSPAAPVAYSAQPFQFGSLVSRGFANINSATLSFSGNASPRSYALSINADFAILDTFSTQAQLDAAYGSGTYDLTVNTSAGVFSRSIFFSPSSYPTTPVLTVPPSDWQNGDVLIDAAVDYTLSWGAFSNAQAGDLIQFTIFNPSLIVRSFPASQSSYTLSAGSLQPNRSYLCDLTFIRVAGSTTGDPEVGPGSARVVTTTKFNIRTRPAPLMLLSAASQKPHGLDAGSFDIPLPLSGPPGVECRIGGTNGFHMLVFTFNNVLVSGNATVTSGTGNIASAPTFLSDRMTVRLNGVANAQTLTVRLSNVTDQHGQVLPDTTVPMAILLGDVNGNRVVNASDIGLAKAQSGQPVNGSNYRADVNINLAINASDVGQVKAQSGTFVP